MPALEDIAEANLKKTRDRWGARRASAPIFDEGFRRTGGCRAGEIELSEIEVDGHQEDACTRQRGASR